jgi:hypothetical protein
MSRPEASGSPGSGRGFLLAQTPYSQLEEALSKEEWQDLEGRCIQWTPIYLYLTMIELLVLLRG